MFLMGIDAGTTSIKVGIYGTTGETITISSERISIETPKVGWAEEDMLDVWNATKSAIKCALKKSKIRGEEILAIGLSGQGGGAWLIDGKGSPVRKAIIWLDLRASNLVEKLKESQKDKELYEITGWRIFPSSGPILLKWLQENEPTTLEKAKYFLRCKDWIKFCLTGSSSTDPSYMISEINIKTNKYSEEVFEILGIKKEYIGLFPQLIPAWKIAGTVNSIAAKETGLKEGTPVSSGGYDVCSCALGAGVINNKQLFAIIGTAGIYAAVVDHPIFDPNQQVSVNLHVIPDRYVLNCQSMTATPNLDWFINEFCKDLITKAGDKNVYKICDSIVSKVPPGAGGILYHPYLQGEIGPFVKASARATFTGLSLWHKRDHLLRAIYEGVGFSMLDNFQKINELLFLNIKPKREITVVGGGAQSDIWLQILADINNTMIIVPEGKELGCKGAAINAGIAVNLYKNHEEAVKNFVKIQKIYKPNEKNSILYDKMFKIYQEIYKGLWDAWDKLVLMQY